MEKKKLIVLCGKSASGKDSLMKEVIKRHGSIFHSITSYTTRARRDNEVEGVDYFFIDKQEMAEKIASGVMLEVVEFNGWFYGTSIDSLSNDAINIGVYNLEGIDCLMQSENEIDMLIFYVTASGKTRLLRSLNREKDPDINEIIRRYGTDEKDFEDLDKDTSDVIVLENESSAQLEGNINKIISLSKMYFNIDV
jgi:guanylate kinase